MPATNRFIPEDWVSMRLALYTWAADYAATIWKEQSATAPAKPYCALRVLVPPIAEGMPGETNIFAVQVETAVNSTVYTITVDAVPVTITSDATATIAEIRNALVTQANTVLGAGTAVAFGVDSLSLDLPGDTNILVTAELALRLAQFYIGQTIMSLQVDVYADGMDEATLLAMQMEAGLVTAPVIEELFGAGWAIVDVLGTRRLAEDLGAAWENRAGFDLRLRALTRSMVLNDFIEVVTPDGIQGFDDLVP